ncbi:MAG: DUF1972 domain-containing protein [Lachnospiraceae bacterium]|nr:DUF1972 domain-containing protein [Lachnospiraceae bacterium]
MQHVFIVGSKGIPAAYGGFETFVDKLTAYRKSNDICYHVSRLSDHNGEYECNGAKCFDVKVPNLGAAKAVYYDVVALRRSITICKKLLEQENQEKEGAVSRPVFYVLACRIGPFARHFARKIHKLGGVLYVNPDGHEWKRSKWSAPIRAYWKYSEKHMVKHADLLVCDSKNIEKYIQEEYASFHPNTTFIAYGSDTRPSALRDDDPRFVNWMKEKGLTPKGYYLVVGRFVPENNYETMLREFLRAKTDKDFAIITTDNPKLHAELDEALHFSMDPRIKFVGTVYDEDLLKKIREQAYGYFHGHEVGGTNPSLLEALGSTDVNLLLEVGFNSEVGEGGALYWNKEEGSLAHLIEHADSMTAEEIAELGQRAKRRITDAYSWDAIVDAYERLFLEGNG